MKYALAFIAAFALSAGVVAWLRAGASDAPPAQPPAEPPAAPPAHQH